MIKLFTKIPSVRSLAFVLKHNASLSFNDHQFKIYEPLKMPQFNLNGTILKFV